MSPGNLHFMGSQIGTVDYFTFLFPVEYISFCINDMLDDKLLKPLKKWSSDDRSQRVKRYSKKNCVSSWLRHIWQKNKKIESEITALDKDKKNSFYNLFLKCGRRAW